MTLSKLMTTLALATTTTLIAPTEVLAGPKSTKSEVQNVSTHRKNVILFSFNGEFEEYACDAALLNQNAARDLRTMCQDKSKITYQFNIVRNPYVPVSGPNNQRIFCTQQGIAGGAGTQMQFGQQYYAPGEPLDCIQVIHRRMQL